MISVRPITKCGPAVDTTAWLFRRGSPLPLITIFAVVAILSGCAIHKQVQYFAATDPETGSTNYYRMTITGSGGGGGDYQMQAGYFSAAAVDVLRGSMPKIPVLDMNIEHEQIFRRLTDQHYGDLLQEAKAIAKITDPEARYMIALGLLERAETKLNDAENRKGELHNEQQELDRLIRTAQDEVTPKQAAVAEASQAMESAEPDARADAATRLEAARNERDEAAAKVELLGAKNAALATRIVETEREIARRTAIVADAAEVTAWLSAAYKQQLQDPGAFAVQAKSPGDLEDEIKQVARLVWFGSLSDSDVISIGMTRNTDPYQFRKLVFWTTANNIGLNEAAAEIDAVIDNVTQIASSYRQQAQQRRKERQSRKKSFEGILGDLPFNSGQKAVIGNLLNLVSPFAADSTDETTPGETP